MFHHIISMSVTEEKKRRKEKELVACLIACVLVLPGQVTEHFLFTNLRENGSQPYYIYSCFVYQKIKGGEGTQMPRHTPNRQNHGIHRHKTLNPQRWRQDAAFPDLAKRNRLCRPHLEVDSNSRQKNNRMLWIYKVWQMRFLSSN